FVVTGSHMLCLKSSGYKSVQWNGSSGAYAATWYQDGQLRSKRFTVKHRNQYRPSSRSAHHFATKKAAETAARKFLETVETDRGWIIAISIKDYLEKGLRWRSNYYLHR